MKQLLIDIKDNALLAVEKNDCTLAEKVVCDIVALNMKRWEFIIFKQYMVDNGLEFEKLGRLSGDIK